MKRTALMVALLLCLPLAGLNRSARAALAADDRSDKSDKTDKSEKGEKQR